MRNVLLALCLLVGIGLVQGCESPGGNYLTTGGGYGGPTKAGNVSIEGGAIKTKKNERHIEGVGGFFICNGGEIPEDAVSTSDPDWRSFYAWERDNDLLIDEGMKRDLPEIGLYGKYGWEIQKDSGFFVSFLAGATFSDEARLYTSKLCPPDYYNDETWKIRGLVGGDLTWFIDNKDFCVQTGYDNRRGFFAGIGCKF